MTKRQRAAVIVALALAVLAGGGFCLRWGLQRVAEDRIADFFQRIRPLVRVEYGQVKVDLLRFTERICDLRLVFVSGQRFEVDEFVLRHLEDRSGYPHALDVSFKGIHVPVEPENFGDMAEEFRDMGYQNATLDLDCAWGFDDGARTFTLDKLVLSGRDLGEMGLTLDLVDVDFDKAVLRHEPAALMAVALRGARLWYRDHQLLNRIICQEAKRRDLPVSVFQHRLEDELDQYLAQSMLEGDDFAVEALSGLRTFLESWGEIAVTAKPNVPVPLFRLQAQSPVAVLGSLGIEVVAK